MYRLPTRLLLRLGHGCARAVPCRQLLSRQLRISDAVHPGHVQPIKRVEHVLCLRPVHCWRILQRRERVPDRLSGRLLLPITKYYSDSVHPGHFQPIQFEHEQRCVPSVHAGRLLPVRRRTPDALQRRHVQPVAIRDKHRLLQQLHAGSMVPLVGFLANALPGRLF